MNRSVNKRLPYLLFFSIVILGLTSTLHAQAQNPSKKVTLSRKNASLGEIFRELNKQTRYQFVFSDDRIKDLPPVSIDVKDATVEDVLTACFKDKPLTWVMQGNAIVVREKQSDASSKKE